MITESTEITFLQKVKKKEGRKRSLAIRIVPRIYIKSFHMNKFKKKTVKEIIPRLKKNEKDPLKILADSRYLILFLLLPRVL